MKKFLALVVLVAMLGVFSGCNASTDNASKPEGQEIVSEVSITEPTNPEDKWVGTWKYDTRESGCYVCFSIEERGKGDFYVESGVTTSPKSGKWSWKVLNDEQVEFSYSDTVFTLTWVNGDYIEATGGDFEAGQVIRFYKSE